MLGVISRWWHVGAWTEIKTDVIAHLWFAGKSHLKFCPRSGRWSAPVLPPTDSLPHTRTRTRGSLLAHLPNVHLVTDSIKKEWTKCPASFWMCPCVASGTWAVVPVKSAGAICDKVREMDQPLPLGKDESCSERIWKDLCVRPCACVSRTL